MDNTLISWETYEYENKNRKIDWFWAVGIIGVAGSVTAFILGNFLFGTFIIISVVALFFMSFNKPERVEVKISEGGLHIKDLFYPFETLKGFHLDDTKDPARLLINSSRFISPVITIPVEDDSMVQDIYDTLLEFLPEQEIRESLTHAFFEKIGF
jgi:hypothetical protein